MSKPNLNVKTKTLTLRFKLTNGELTKRNNFPLYLTKQSVVESQKFRTKQVLLDKQNRKKRTQVHFAKLTNNKIEIKSENSNKFGCTVVSFGRYKRLVARNKYICYRYGIIVKLKLALILLTFVTILFSSSHPNIVSATTNERKLNLFVKQHQNRNLNISRTEKSVEKWQDIKILIDENKENKDIYTEPARGKASIGQRNFVTRNNINQTSNMKNVEMQQHQQSIRPFINERTDEARSRVKKDNNIVNDFYLFQDQNNNIRQNNKRTKTATSQTNSQLVLDSNNNNTKRVKLQRSAFDFTNNNNNNNSGYFDGSNNESSGFSSSITKLTPQNLQQTTSDTNNNEEETNLLQMASISAPIPFDTSNMLSSHNQTANQSDLNDTNNNNHSYQFEDSLASFTTNSANLNDDNNNSNLNISSSTAYWQSNVNSVNGTVDLSLYSETQRNILYDDALLVYLKNFNE